MFCWMFFYCWLLNDLWCYEIFLARFINRVGLFWSTRKFIFPTPSSSSSSLYLNLSLSFYLSGYIFEKGFSERSLHNSLLQMHLAVNILWIHWWSLEKKIQWIRFGFHEIFSFFFYNYACSWVLCIFRLNFIAFVFLLQNLGSNYASS